MITYIILFLIIVYFTCNAILIFKFEEWNDGIDISEFLIIMFFGFPIMLFVEIQLLIEKILLKWYEWKRK